MKTKLLIFMMMGHSFLFAAPMTEMKWNYTEFYHKGEYLFSILQEWEFEHQTGDPTPLPMIINESIYAQKTGLEPLLSKTNGEIYFENPEWLSAIKWKEFVQLNSLPIEIYVHKNASVIVKSDLQEQEFAWFLNTQTPWCEYYQDACQPKAYSFEYKFERKLPCIDFDVWWCENMGVSNFEPYWDEVYINNSIGDVQDANKVFITKIDLIYKTVLSGPEGSGIMPFVTFH